MPCLALKAFQASVPHENTLQYRLLLRCLPPLLDPWLVLVATGMCLLRPVSATLAPFAVDAVAAGFGTAAVLVGGGSSGRGQGSFGSLGTSLGWLWPQQRSTSSSRATVIRTAAAALPRPANGRITDG